MEKNRFTKSLQRILQVLLLPIFGVLSSTCWGQACHIGDSLELVALYNATTLSSWTTQNVNGQRSPWMLTQPVLSWYGVTLDNSGRVQRITLRNNGLNGRIPNLNLPNLNTLNLAENNLIDTIPNFNLPNLRDLHLFSNQLSGNIPLFNLPNLLNLVLYANRLSGSVPNFTISNVPNLKSLYLAENRLIGGIPFFSLPNLEELNLMMNALTGSIPNFSITQVPRLKLLILRNNQLTGTIPNFNLPTLETLWLGDNLLTGSIPTLNLTQLRSLILSNNQLSGSIPNFNLPYLEELNVLVNQLSGAIPNFNLPNLKMMFLNDNQLSGSLPNFNLPNLQSLWVERNQLTGNLPNLNLPNLQQLYVGDNQLTGNIPPFNLPQLQKLVLNTNQLSGCIPTSIKVRCPNIGPLGGTIFSNPNLYTQNWADYWNSNVGACSNNRMEMPDSTLITCAGTCIPIILRAPLNNVNGFTVRLQFDTTKVKPDSVIFHALGQVVPSPDSASRFQNVVGNILNLTISLQGWRNINANIGDTLACISFKAVGSTPQTVLKGIVESSFETGGIQVDSIKTRAMVQVTGAILLWNYYQGTNLMSWNTVSNPTKILVGTPLNMVFRQNMSVGTALITPWNANEFIQLQRKSTISLGMPEIGGFDAFLTSLVVNDAPTATRVPVRLITMDVNRDTLITAGDVSSILRRAVKYQSGFKQISGDTVSWRHFPKSQLTTNNAFKLSTTFPNDDQIGISRHRVPMIDTLFNINVLPNCDTLAMDVISLCLGDCDGNLATTQSSAKGLLSGEIRIDGSAAVKDYVNQIFRVPVYANENMMGFDFKIENYLNNLQIVSVSNGPNVTLQANLDSMNRNCYISGYSTAVNGIPANTLICSLNIKTNCFLRQGDIGNVTTYLNGLLASHIVTEHICTGPPPPPPPVKPLIIFPNPTTGLVTIDFGDENRVKMDLFNSLGQRIQTVEPTGTIMNLDLSMYAIGVFYLKVGDKAYKIHKIQ
jgi:Secretion system C-terminal sorting domain/Leucine Rich repeats (2 copies)